MRILPILLIAATTACATAPASAPRALDTTDPATERVRRILSETPLVDGHNDLPWAIRQNEAAPGDVATYDLRGRAPGHTDIPRLRKGMVGVQFWSVYIRPVGLNEGAARTQLEQIDIARQVIERNPDVFELAGTADEAMRIFRTGKIASSLGIEGGNSIENSLGALRAYYDLGVRYMTLTHSANTDWADAATAPPRHDGLSEFGKEVVREMNRLGMMVDLSHTSPATMHDALDVSVAPVIFSHSSARAVTEHPRNVPDDVLKRLPANGGIVMVTFVPEFLDNATAEWSRQPEEYRKRTPPPGAAIRDVVAHIEHIRNTAGIDHVGIGGDFDGITLVPRGLEDVSTYPALLVELARRGWSDADLRKLAGENAMRVWRRNEEVAARLQATRPPSTATIERLDAAR